MAACAFDEARGGADEHHSLRRVAGFAQRLGDARQHIGAKRETR
jgi:hypothetical protein